jgi:hypothetical protein
MAVFGAGINIDLAQGSLVIDTGAEINEWL